MNRFCKNISAFKIEVNYLFKMILSTLGCQLCIYISQGMLRR